MLFALVTSHMLATGPYCGSRGKPELMFLCFWCSTKNGTGNQGGFTTCSYFSCSPVPSLCQIILCVNRCLLVFQPQRKNLHQSGTCITNGIHGLTRVSVQVTACNTSRYASALTVWQKWSRFLVPVTIKCAVFIVMFLYKNAGTCRETNSFYLHCSALHFMFVIIC